MRIGDGRRRVDGAPRDEGHSGLRTAHSAVRIAAMLSHLQRCRRRGQFARASAPALSIVAVLSAGACGAATSAGAHQGERDDVRALEASIARLEERQLDHIQRQRELEAELAGLKTQLQRLGAPDAADGEPDPGAGAAPSPGDRPPRPDPDEVLAVPVDGAPYEGPEDALVTLVHAFEFSCPHCHRARDTLAELREEYGDDLRIVHVNFIVNPQAVAPALAACAGHLQNRHAEIKARIWERGYEAGRDFSPENMREIAQDLDLDMERFEADMRGEACQSRLEADLATMQRLGARGTPTSFINGRPVTGAQPARAFRAVIDEELAKARERVEAGADPASYYEDWVATEGADAAK